MEREARQRVPFTVGEERLWSLLDLMPLGVVVTEGGWVRRVNRSAERMIKSSGALAILNGRLTAGDPATDRRLTAALAVAPDAPPETCVALLRLRREGKRSLELCVVSIGDGFATILISDPAQRIAPDSGLLSSLYRFTPAESRVVTAMLEGSTPAATASCLGISVNTVRRHLKQIFAKARVRRQADLVRLVSAGLGSLQMRGTVSARVEFADESEGES